MEWQPECVGFIKLCTHWYPQPVTVSKLEPQPSKGRNRPGRHPRESSGPHWTPVKNLSSTKQRQKALNMESQCGLGKVQCSSPPLVCVYVLHRSVSVSLIEFQIFRVIKRGLYVYITNVLRFLFFSFYAATIYNTSSQTPWNHSKNGFIDIA